MCHKKDKIRQSDAKISLMIMVKIKEWSSKLHVEQLPSKKPGKKLAHSVGFTPLTSEILELYSSNIQAPSWIPNHNLGEATAS